MPGHHASEYRGSPALEIPLMSIGQAQGYGIRLGSTATVAKALDFVFGIEHVGWVVGAGLFVMRPSQDVLEFRSKGRPLSVFLRALTAS